MPKNKPTITAKVSARTIGVRLMLVVIAPVAFKISAKPAPSATPIKPLVTDSAIDFHQKLQENILSPRANGFAQADFFCALGHANQHNVHNADAADEERDARDRGEKNRQSGRDTRQCRKELGLVANLKIILAAVRRQIMSLAYQCLNASTAPH